MAQDLAATEQEHFQLFRSMGFLQRMETEEGVFVVLIGRHFQWSATKALLPSLQKFAVAELEAVADRPFRLVYIHTGASYLHNSPGIWWLWRTYAALPQHVRTHVLKCYVLHADWALRASAAALCPLLAAEFWGKLEYVPRAEFLPAELQAVLSLPDFVAEHEQDLARQPLMDYGIAADSDETPLPHLSGLKAAGG